ncbi:MAG: histidine--tRNA ligase [Clostridiales bacterium]|nr:histidine--tRNA ligase [Clostridiales bacterium]
MALTKKPVTGMKDILPQEMQIRDYVIAQIKETYKSFGFTPIETPVVENLPNLTSKQGGDNEKLIFKVMKRGEKFNLEKAACEDDLADSGLRYDLTVPLVRYYSNHANELPKPFKALQIGPVFRADRPQKGRFRQFYQCDIDILGEAGNLAEIELILATTTLLGKLGFEGFTVHINDRKILKAMAAYSGFPEESYDQVFIILDKMDKIGLDGVASELAENGFEQAAIDKYLSLFQELEQQEDGISYLGEKLAGVMEEGTAENLKQIVDSVVSTTSTRFNLMFDPTLVRGMSYYTGTIFEIEIAGLGCSAGGGGRYDEMVGKFTNMKTPACGFSIGFERIITILLDQGFQVPGASQKKAFLIEKNMPADRMCEIMKEAQEIRAQGTPVLVSVMNKNKKFQKEQLTAEGYTEFKEFYVNPMRG